IARMLAVVKEAAREGAIRVREVARARPGPGRVLLEVGAASVCGSDLHIWHWAPAFHAVLKPPRVIGHEFVGRVAELGPGVEGPPAGARVVVAGVEADRAVRLVAAEQLGLGAINVEREPVAAGLQRLTGRDRADLAFECAGSGAALRSALEVVEKGGTVVLVALYGGPVETDLAWVVRRELSLQATYAANWIDYERSIGF